MSIFNSNLLLQLILNVKGKQVFVISLWRLCVLLIDNFWFVFEAHGCFFVWVHCIVLKSNPCFFICYFCHKYTAAPLTCPIVESKVTGERLLASLEYLILIQRPKSCGSFAFSVKLCDKNFYSKQEKQREARVTHM